LVKTVLNTNNTSFREGYKAFLGEDLGLNDSIHVQYPEIRDMYLSQRAKFWTESEIDLSKDRLDLQEASKDQKDVMLLNLMTQWLLDSTASRSILQTFSPFISNTEVEDLLTVQTFMEGIHARSYSEILRVCYNNPTELMEEAYNNVSVCYRTKVIGEVFNKTNKIGAKLELGLLDLDKPEDLEEIQEALLVNLAVLYGLE